MPTIAELRAEAVQLGLEGEALTEFIYKQQSFYRDERAAERAAHNAELLAVREREQLAAEREKEREQLAAELERERRDHEIRMLELRSPRDSEVQLSDAAAKPKLPMYRDGEDITSYIIRFERIAELLQLNRSSYAVRLGTLLTGKAVQIYAALSPDVTGDYDSLKKALLSGFNKTHETYREEFRAARIGWNETYLQFATQLGRKLDYWLESRDVPKDYASVREFFIIDQFLSSLPPPLRLFIKEKDCKQLSEIVTLADNWSAAHKAYPKDSHMPKYQPDVKGNSPSRATAIQKPTRNLDNRQEMSKGCFSCGDSGHVKRNCPKNPLLFPKPSPTRAISEAVHRA
ncbi:hypothetical protein HAZT_HAZT010215 [Hyalella azteca]|uniref:CCHC-type domain-containing protein n=1 Tax=Hyalella azteca TaxID=294128 RepID=A0A6A0H2G1_HYAAZ|nr:hypothetical protein HAZT_HAZT010215 [Hyalella azteca]